MRKRPPSRKQPQQNNAYHFPVGEGEKKPGSISSPPFLFTEPRLHPGISLWGYLSLITAAIYLSRYDWSGVLFLWAGTLILTLLSCPRPLKAFIRMLGILPFLCVALIIHALFTPGTILFHTGTLYITREGIDMGAWITLKLALFFLISFAMTLSIPSLFLFQLMDRLRQIPLPYHFPVRLWIITLFLILRWLHLLPGSWKRQVQEVTRGVPGKMGKTHAGLRRLPWVLKNEINGLERWTHLLVRRGYAEGILTLAEGPMAPFNKKDTLVFLGSLLAWGAWIYRLI